MKEGPQSFDLTVRASDLILPEAYNFSEDKPGENKPLQRRIIAVTEGVHNQTEVSAAELKEMVARADEIKSKENRELYPVPIVLDHSYRFLDKTGGTFGLEYSDKIETPNGKLPGVTADIEFWEDTPIQKEVAARIRRDPENTYFSIRFYGMLHYDSQNDRYFWTDMVLVHIAVVNEPADGNARIMDELSKSDFSLKSVQENKTVMENADFEKRLADLEKENTSLRAWKDSKEQAELAVKEAANKEDLHKRAQVIAELMALDKSYDKELVESFSLEQLEKYKASLERLFPKDSSEKGTANAGEADSAAELAKKYYME